MNRITDFVSGVLDQKGEAYSKAGEYLQDRTDPKSPNYDKEFAEEAEKMTPKEL